MRGYTDNEDNYIHKIEAPEIKRQTEIDNYKATAQSHKKSFCSIVNRIFNQLSVKEIFIYLLKELIRNITFIECLLFARLQLY